VQSCVGRKTWVEGKHAAEVSPTLTRIPIRPAALIAGSANPTDFVLKFTTIVLALSTLYSKRVQSL
jgi:hypothetical protein